MKKMIEKNFLLITSLVSVILLPFAIFKKSFKDWIIVYLVSLIGNSLLDRALVSKGYIEYDVRPFPKKFGIHLPFDYLHYPLMLLYYNQWTLNSRPMGILLKTFPFIIPQVFIETMAERNTDLITWKKGWTWKHSFISLFMKFLFCRMIIGAIRLLNEKTVSITGGKEGE